MATKATEYLRRVPGGHASFDGFLVKRERTCDPWQVWEPGGDAQRGLAKNLGEAVELIEALREERRVQ